MGHHHHGGHHHHSHASSANTKVLFAASFLTLSFALLEIFVSFISGSLVLLSEGVHMASDGISLLLGWLAVFFGVKVANHRKTFGYKRLETIAAFLNGIGLLIVPIWVMSEALKRFFHQEEVMGGMMLWVAIIGLVINLFVAYLLSKGDTANINLRAALLHVVSDLLSSAVTIITAVIILLFDWHWVDPVSSLLVSMYILKGGWKITKESFHLLMEGTPNFISVETIEKEVLGLPFVCQIDGIKIWSMNGEETYGLLKIGVDEQLYDSMAWKSLLETLQKFPKMHWTIQTMTREEIDIFSSFQEH